MQISFDQSDLQPLVNATVEAVLQQLTGGEAKAIDGQIAYTEPAAAELLGLPTHSLRDARRRGEIRPGKVGSRFLYSRTLLEEFAAGLEGDR